ETVLRDLHFGPGLLHLLAQSLHLGNSEARIVSDDDHGGVLEDTVERGDELLLSRSIHCKLFPVWRTASCEDGRRLRPAVRTVATTGRTAFLCPAPETALAAPVSEVRTGRGARPRRVESQKSVSTRLCRRLSRENRHLQSRTGLVRQLSPPDTRLQD